MNNKIKVLLVEDHKIAQLAAKLIIEQANCQVDVASSGKEALEKISLHHYDIIFMDIGLEEGTDGFMITETIRKNNGLNKTTPIIALTAHESETYKRKAEEVGMQAYLIKPVQTDQIIDIIAKVFLEGVDD